MNKELYQLVWDYTTELGEIVEVETIKELNPEFSEEEIDETINEFIKSEAGQFYN